MQIRNYKSLDKKHVIEMVSEILGNIFNGDPTQFKVLKEFKVTKNYILFLVAETGGKDKKIIGTMALKKIDKDIVRLKRMYVRKEYRGRGIAQKLLNQITRFAKEKGYKKIIFSSYPIMENAQRFNRKNRFAETKGFDSEQIHVVREL